MQRARRFALVALLGLLGVPVLAGCGRSQPGVAAYVGDTRYTEEHIEQLADEARGSGLGDRLGNVRRAAVSWLVLNDLARRVAAERAIAVRPASYEEVSEQLNLPADHGLVRAYADWLAVANALAANVEANAPTDEDLRVIYEGLRDTGRVPQGMTVEQVIQQLRADPNLPRVVGVRNVLADAARRHRLTINPRYRPLVANVGDIPLTLAEGSDAVTELATR